MEKERTLEELVKDYQRKKRSCLLELWDRMQPLIKYRARQRDNVIMGKYGNDAEDYIQEAFLVLVRCAELYDSGKPGFKTYYLNACNNMFSRMDKWDNRRKKHRVLDTISLYEDISDDDDGDMTMLDILKSDVDVEKEVTDRIFIEEILAKLPKKKRDVARAYFLEDLTLEEIAEQTGCKKQYVGRLLQETINDLVRRYKGTDR